MKLMIKSHACVKNLVPLLRSSDSSQTRAFSINISPHWGSVLVLAQKEGIPLLFTQLLNATFEIQPSTCQDGKFAPTHNPPSP
jgi:hypothetical protein